jgi:Mrp family chromosome partitioning ATPase
MNYPIGTQLRESTATEPTLHAQAHLLRARVEAGVGKPAVILVTSACTGDGKSLTAYSLAASLAKCNHRVALVSPSCEEYHQLSIMQISREEGSSHDRLTGFVKRMRSDYEFTIIDAETFVKNSTVIALANLVDAILLAVRIGRAPTVDDEAMVRILEQFDVRVVGVVATEDEAIANFSRAQGRARPRTGVNGGTRETRIGVRGALLRCLI